MNEKMTRIVEPWIGEYVNKESGIVVRRWLPGNPEGKPPGGLVSGWSGYLEPLQEMTSERAKEIWERRREKFRERSLERMKEKAIIHGHSIKDGTEAAALTTGKQWEIAMQPEEWGARASTYAYEKMLRAVGFLQDGRSTHDGSLPKGVEARLELSDRAVEKLAHLMSGDDDAVPGERTVGPGEESWTLAEFEEAP